MPRPPPAVQECGSPTCIVYIYNVFILVVGLIDGWMALPGLRQSIVHTLLVF